MAPQTWHYGLVAKWWAEFNEGGPEIEYFRRFIEDDGQPALDVACGTGRLLLPYLHAGLDVDGCDVSEDMIALCRERAEREGLSPTLFVAVDARARPAALVPDDRRVRWLRRSAATGRTTSRRSHASTSTWSPAARSSSTTRSRMRTRSNGGAGCERSARSSRARGRRRPGSPARVRRQRARAAGETPRARPARAARDPRDPRAAMAGRRAGRRGGPHARPRPLLQERARR